MTLASLGRGANGALVVRAARWGGGEGDAKGGPLAGLALDAEGAPVQFNEPVAEIEPEAEAAVVFHRDTPPELLEHLAWRAGSMPIP
jgi:hypothetical protein